MVSTFEYTSFIYIYILDILFRLPSALQLAVQSYVVMSAFGSSRLLIAIFLHSSGVHILLQLSVSHIQDVNLLVLMHLVFGHKPSPAEQFRVKDNSNPLRSLMKLQNLL